MTELYAKLITIFYVAGFKVKNFFKEEKGAVDIVAVVVLIGVAVLLAIVFKDALGKLITNLFKTITDNSTGVVNEKL